MKLIDIINREYISSSIVTKQYKEAKRQFKTIMRKMFKGDEVFIGSCPHFEFTGFIRRDKRYVYFSTGDLRWKLMNAMLVRTAKNDKDYMGGGNTYVTYDHNFDINFKSRVDDLFAEFIMEYD